MAMYQSIHRVKRVTLGRPYKQGDEVFVVDIKVETEEADFEITLFSKTAEGVMLHRVPKA